MPSTKQNTQKRKIETILQHQFAKKDEQAYKHFKNGCYQQAITYYESALHILQEQIPKWYNPTIQAQFKANTYIQLARCYRFLANEVTADWQQLSKKALDYIKLAYQCQEQRLDILYEKYLLYQNSYAREPSKKKYKILNQLCDQIIQFNDQTHNNSVSASEGLEKASLIKTKMLTLQARIAFAREQYERVHQLAISQGVKITTYEPYQTLYHGYLYLLAGSAVSMQAQKSAQSSADKRQLYQKGWHYLKQAETHWQQTDHELARQKNYDYGRDLYVELSQLLDNSEFTSLVPEQFSINKLISYYQLTEQQGVAEASHNLGVMYLEGQQIDQNFNEAFQYFHKAAKKGCYKAKIDLAGCYLKGQGCEADPKQAYYWASQCLNDPLAQYYYATSLLLICQQHPEQNHEKHQASQDIIYYLERAIANGCESANGQLALIYHHGPLNITPDYTKAEHHYRRALALGQDQCAGPFLSLLYEQLLETASNTLQYQAIKQAATELAQTYLHKLTEIDLNSIDTQTIKTIVDDMDVSRQSFAMLVNKAITSHTRNNTTSLENKIIDILNHQSHLSDSINIATSMLNLGYLLEHMDYDAYEWIVRNANSQARFSFHELLTKCRTLFEQKQFSQRSLANIITGLGKWYRHYYQQEMTVFIVEVLKQIANNTNNLDLLTFNSILASSLVWPLQRDESLFDAISQFVNQTESLQTQLLAQGYQDLTNTVYSLTVLDHYYRQTKRTNHEPLAIKWAEWSQYITQWLNKKNELTKQQLHQLCWSALYMATYQKPKGGNSYFDHTLLSQVQTILAQPEHHNPRTSTLQTKVANDIHSLGIRVKQEWVINGLPVDIWLPDHNTIVQVDGPHHYLHYNEQQSLCQTIKDDFHDAILLSPNFAAPNNLVDPNYQIIHLNYQKLDAQGSKYIIEQLEQKGLITSTMHSTSTAGSSKCHHKQPRHQACEAERKAKDHSKTPSSNAKTMPQQSFNRSMAVNNYNWHQSQYAANQQRLKERQGDKKPHNFK